MRGASADSKPLKAHHIDNLANEVQLMNRSKSKSQRRQKKMMFIWLFVTVVCTAFVSTITGFAVRFHYSELLHAEHLKHAKTSHASNAKDAQVGKLEQSRYDSERNWRLKEEEVKSLTADFDKANKTFKEALSEKDEKINASRISLTEMMKQLSNMKTELNSTKEASEKTNLGLRTELTGSRDTVKELRISMKFKEEKISEKEIKIQDLEKSLKTLEGERNDEYRVHRRKVEKSLREEMDKELKANKVDWERKIGDVESLLATKISVLRRLRQDGIVDQNFAYPIPDNESRRLQLSYGVLLIFITYFVLFG